MISLKIEILWKHPSFNSVDVEVQTIGSRIFVFCLRIEHRVVLHVKN